MSFALSLALKNIRRKPFRAVATALLVMFLSFTLFAGAVTVTGLQNGLSGYKARLGADIIVVPNSSKGHGTVDDILLGGITGAYYMSGREVEKIAETDGVEAVSRQFFLTSAKASCCSSRVQIIGFDPETDFSVMPWIAQSYSGEIADGDIIIGANVTMPGDGTIKFYGETYCVAAQLAQTGTGLDSAVYTNMATMEHMAKNAADLFDTAPFKGVDSSNAASAVLIKVRDGYEISEVADDINIHVTKVQAKSARTMISDISRGLSGVSTVIGVLVAVIWVLSVVIMMVVFALMSNERRKEFAVLRVMGASKSMLFAVMCYESAAVCLAGALLGLMCALAVAFPVTTALSETLELPMLMPSAGALSALAAGTLVLSALSGVATAGFSAHCITRSETALLLKENT